MMTSTVKNGIDRLRKGNERRRHYFITESRGQRQGLMQLKQIKSVKKSCLKWIEKRNKTNQESFYWRVNKGKISQFTLFPIQQLTSTSLFE